MSFIKRYPVSLGCDPELFLKQGSNIIGSEKVITSIGEVIRDGVQVEFNPQNEYCRQDLGRNIKRCFDNLRSQLKAGINPDFNISIEVSDEEYNSLGNDAKQLGCKASKSSYKERSKITKSKKTTKQRSAGGHIHLGYGDSMTYEAMKEEEAVVTLLDIIVGNTCVLIDRDPGNITRRKLYGRAGEYRTTSYGLEYRVLSNFWLRHYVIFSLVFNLARFAVRILATDYDTGSNHYTNILEKVNLNDIRKAINNNDFNLAQKNFNAIKDYLKEISGDESADAFALSRVEAFEKLYTDGLDKHFSNDYLANWSKQEFEYGFGWESFANHLK